MITTSVTFGISVATVRYNTEGVREFQPRATPWGTSTEKEKLNTEGVRELTFFDNRPLDSRTLSGFDYSFRLLTQGVALGLEAEEDSATPKVFANLQAGNTMFVNPYRVRLYNPAS